MNELLRPFRWLHRLLFAKHNQRKKQEREREEFERIVASLTKRAPSKRDR